LKPEGALAARLKARRLSRSALGVPKIARHSLHWDVLAGASTGIYMGMLLPFLIRTAKDLHAPDAAITVINIAPFVGNLFAPLWARQMEGRSKLPFVVASWTVARASLFLLPILALFPTISLAWSFTGIISFLMFVGTVASPAYAALMKDIYPDRTRGRLMGYVRVAAQIGMFTATSISGRLLDHGLHFQTLFAISAVFGIAAAAFFSQVRPMRQDNSTRTDNSKILPDPSASKAVFSDLLTILKNNHGYRWFALSVMAYGFGNLMAQPIYALFQVEILHIRPTQIANLANAASLASIVGSVFWGRVVDRYGAPRTVFWCILLVALISVVYLLSSSINALFFASFLSGFGLSGIELSYMASILTYSEKGRAAQYQSLHSLLLGVRGVLAPVIGIPLLRAVGFHRIFALTLILMLLGALMQNKAARLAPNLDT
jgi:MFS transporter, DHA1 family, staphyloferrin B biosynthesis exporter